MEWRQVIIQSIVMSVVAVNHLHQPSLHSLHPVNVRPVGIAEHSVCMLDWHLNKQQISTQYSILALFSSSYIIISWKHLVLWIIWGIFSLLWTSMLTVEIFKINVQEDNSNILVEKNKDFSFFKKDSETNLWFIIFQVFITHLLWL